MTETLTTPVAAPATVPAREFETVACGRCGGDGRYGPLCVYSGICFKCNGAGKLYTKRGLAARNHFERLCSVTAGCVVSGLTIQTEDMLIGPAGVAFRRTWAKVLSVVPRETDAGVGYTIEAAGVKTGRSYHLDLMETSLVRVGQSADEKAAKRAAALDFQGTLTASGTVAKRKRKA